MNNEIKKHPGKQTERVANDLKNQKGQEMINEELQLQAPQGNDDALKEERHKQPKGLK